MAEQLCILSFGNSAKYRLTLPDCNKAEDVKKQVKAYLESKFPMLSDLDYYDTMTVTEVSGDKVADYAKYPEFGQNSVVAIEKVLATEVLDQESLERLNRNAPFDNID